MHNNAYARGFETCRRQCAVLMCQRCAESQFDARWTVEHNAALGWHHRWADNMPMEHCRASAIYSLVCPDDPERPQ